MRYPEKLAPVFETLEVDSKETLIAPGLDKLLRDKGPAIMQDEKLMARHMGAFLQPSSRDLVFGVLFSI